MNIVAIFILIYTALYTVSVLATYLASAIRHQGMPGGATYNHSAIVLRQLILVALAGLANYIY